MELATSAMEQVWQRLGVSAHNPVRQFQIVYCSWLAIAMLFNMRNHCRFYRWFSSSRCLPPHHGRAHAHHTRADAPRPPRVVPRPPRRVVPRPRSSPTFTPTFAARSIPLASKRGLGAHPSKIYGLFTPPTLTLLQLKAAGVAFTACLLLACTPLAPRVFCFLAYVLYFFYFTQARAHPIATSTATSTTSTSTPLPLLFHPAVRRGDHLGAWADPHPVCALPALLLTLARPRGAIPIRVLTLT